MPVPTPRLALVAAAGALLQLAVAVVAPAVAWLVLLGWLAVVAGLAAVDLATAPDPAAVVVERSMPDVVALGQHAHLRWRIVNPLDRPLSVAVADELAPSLRAETRRTRVDVPARGTADVEVPLRPSRRGRFAPREVVVRVDGVQGLMARQRAREVPGQLRVHPVFRSWKEAELRINRSRLLHLGVRAARLRGTGTEFDHLRDYTVDDESRRIDWAATARAGRPIVKTFRAERNQTVVNLLDTGRTMAGRVEGVPRLEHAMDAVMTLTAVATGLGDRCGLAAFDRSVHTVVGAHGGSAQLGRVTSALYDIEPALLESDYTTSFAAALGRFRRRTMLVIHSELIDAVVTEALLPAMPLVTRSHVVVVASVRDPEVVDWAHRPVVDGDEARRRAAAVLSLEDRDRAAARLRAAGATVIDEAPTVVSARLADTYLQIKATGRL